MTPRILLSRVLVYLHPNPDHPDDEGVFLCNDGSVDEEFFIFLKHM